MARGGSGIGSSVAGSICGVIASVGSGAFVGLTLWATGLGVGSPLVDWLIAGAAFGLVVGGGGVVTSGLVRGAARALVGNHDTLPFGIRVAVGAFGGTIPGVLLGQSFHRGMTEPIIYGVFGAIGAAVATLVGDRASKAMSRLSASKAAA